PDAHVVSRNRVGQVDDARAGAAARDHAVADTHELVRQAVVGEERDQGRGSAHGSAGPRAAVAASASSASRSPSMSWRCASTSGSMPCSRRVWLVTGPIETTRVAGESAGAERSPPCWAAATASRKKRTVEEEVK